MTINIDDLTLRQIREIQKLVPTVEKIRAPQAHQSHFIGKTVILRCNASGVFLADLAGKQGQQVFARNAYRVFCWEGAFTLSEVSQTGISKGSRVSQPMPEIEISDCIEVIPVTDRAKESILNYVEQ